MTRLDYAPLDGLGVGIATRVAAILDEGLGDELRALWRQHHLLLFRGEDLDRATQEALLGLLGKVNLNDPSSFVSNVRKDVLGQNELAWHSDLIYTPEPHFGVSLYAVVADPDISTTRFADTHAAADRLPAALRARLERLSIMNISGGLGGSARNRGPTLDDDWPRHVRPIIDINPQNGRAFISATLSQTSHVEGVPQAESDALLEELYDILYDPAHIAEHRWRTGDLLVWDNLALQHSRRRLLGTGRRDLERVTFGGRLVHEQYPEWIARMERSLAEQDLRSM